MPLAMAKARTRGPRTEVVGFAPFNYRRNEIPVRRMRSLGLLRASISNAARTKSIRPADVHEVVKLLRLQGKTNVIDRLRKELGAVGKAEQPRDAAGRWKKEKRTLREGLRR
jgi:hypothetical protein